MEPITAQTIEESNVVTMRVESPDPEDAATILSAALEIYPETARFVLGEIQFNMLDEMEVPKHPYNQMSVKKSLAAGAVAGLLLACGILGVLSLLRRTARDPEEMKQVTSLKCLAMIPHIQVKARKNQSRRRISVLDERTPYGYRESMRSLRVRLEGRPRRKDVRWFLSPARLRRREVCGGGQSGAESGGRWKRGSADRWRSAEPVGRNAAWD